MRLLTAFLFFVFIQSCCCDFGKRTNRKYIIENNTVHEIQVGFYEYSRYLYGDSISGKGVLSEGMASDDGMGRIISASSAFHTDSIIITFNKNDRRQIYYYKKDQVKSIPSTAKNLLSDSSYFKESDELYRFILTEEDYKNAEEL